MLGECKTKCLQDTDCSFYKTTPLSDIFQCELLKFDPNDVCSCSGGNLSNFYLFYALFNGFILYKSLIYQ